MTHAWTAEQVVDEPTARALLASVPGLEIRSLGRLAEGWDRDVWLLNGELAVAFPRRAIGLPGIERELAVLPRLAPRLPLPVSEPVFTGEAGEGFPWPFAASRVVPGIELWEAELDGAGWARVGRELGGFLRELHRPEVLAEVGAELPLDHNRRADMAFRAEKLRELLGRLREAGAWDAPALVEELLAEAEALPEPARLAVCHGDLHPRHVLIHEAAIAGVIDWNDLCRADPAIDLLLVWSMFPPEARAAFLDAYGEVDAASELRARVLGVFLCAALAEQAYADGDSRFVAALVAAAERAVAR